jgi:hypothetical protein
VATLDLANFPCTSHAEVDFAEDFFAREALLTVSASDLQSEHKRYRISAFHPLRTPSADNKRQILSTSC